MATMRSPSVPVSWGELLDKLTILAIKRKRIATPAARAHVDREYRLLQSIGAQALVSQEVGRLVERLRQVNERLWEVEDAIRGQEAAADFGPGFIRLARTVYKVNDRRAAIKREINALLDSELVEEKSYARPDSTAPAPMPGPAMPPGAQVRGMAGRAGNGR
jgi:hypothetical protein